jgi:PAS domain S-box-containing protein
MPFYLKDSFFQKLDRPVGIFDFEGNLIESNPYWLNAFGWSEIECPKKDWQKWVFSQDLNLAIESICQNSQTNHEVYLRVHTPREIRQLKFEITRVHDQNIVYVIVQNYLFGDLDSRVFQSAFDDGIEPMAIMGSDGRFFEVNGALADLLSTPKSKLIGKNIANFFNPDEEARDHLALEEVFSGFRPFYQVTKLLRTSDPKGKWIDLKTQLVRNLEVGAPFCVAFFTDLTERRNAAESLQQSELRQRKIVECAPMGIVESLPTTKIISANSAIQKLLGFSEFELQALSLLELTNAEDRLEAIGLAKDRDKNNWTIQRHRKRLRRKDGAYVWVHVTSSRQDFNGQIISIIEDISDHIAFEQELRAANLAIQQEKQNFETLAKALNQFAMVAAVDCRGLIIFANPMMLETLGYSCEEMNQVHQEFKAGNKDHGIFDPAEISNSSGLWRGEIIVTKKDGTALWVDSTVTPVMNMDGQEIRIVIRRDITARKVAENELLKLSGYRRSIIDSANFAVITTDLDGKINFFNSTAEKWLGYKADEMIGNKPAIYHVKDEVIEQASLLSKVYQEDILPGFQVFVFKAMKEGNAQHEWTYVRKDGSTFPGLVSVTVVRGEDGNPSGFLAIIQDLTSQKQLEKAIAQQRESMLGSAKMASLGEMSAAIAHEINNPLAVISARMHLLSKQLSDIKIGKVQEHFETVNRQTDRIAKIIQGLRTFSRHTSNDPFLKSSVKTILEDVRTLSDAKLKNSDVELTFKTLGADLQFECRAAEIAQVMFNLIANAYDAVADLPKKWIQVEVSESKEALIFSVTDSGNGIDKKIVSRLFDPFFTTKDVGKGTGLGLNIAHGIVAKHGGQLTVDSSCENTRFIFSLPKFHSVESTPEAA